MRVVVTGDFRNPTLLDTEEATGLLIFSPDGKPNTIFRITSDGKGWVRYTKGEDACFEEIGRALGLL